MKVNGTKRNGVSARTKTLAGDLAIRATAVRTQHEARPDYAEDMTDEDQEEARGAIDRIRALFRHAPEPDKAA